MTTIVEYTEIAGGYRVTMQHAKCRHCAGRIERVKVREGVAPATWGHASTGRSTCLLPADATKVAQPE